jgi:hypothetical protein
MSEMICHYCGKACTADEKGEAYYRTATHRPVCQGCVSAVEREMTGEAHERLIRYIAEQRRKRLMAE